jgi:hypothetical protein
MSYIRVDEWCEPTRPNVEFRPGTFLGPRSLLFTSGSPSAPARLPEVAVARENGDRWLLELLGEDHCVRVLIAEGEEE